MPRIGINPGRGQISDYRPARVTVTLLTYIPDLSGYFTHRLEVLKVVLDSLYAHTQMPYDLMVFDNGSCSQVVDELDRRRQDGQIDFLLLSQHNIGKIGALRILFEAAPGEIIAYSDDDILFYPGWLNAQVELLDSFPQAGMISGVPVRDAARHAHSSLDALIDHPPADIKVSQQRLIPDEWEVDWAISTGRDPQAHLAETKERLDMVLEIQIPEGSLVQAVGSANHFQFISPKSLILQALPTEWSGKLMGHMAEMDAAIDALGCLRLSTTERYTRHLGNALSVETLSEIQDMALLDTAPNRPPSISSTRKRHWSLRIPGMRRIYKAVYRRLFDILFR